MNIRKLILIIVFLYSVLLLSQKAVFAQEEQSEVPPKIRTKLLEIGLYLQTGTGIPGWLEIGTIFDEKNRPVIDVFEEVFGLSIEIDSSSRRVRHISCTQPSCYTENNIAVGDAMEDVLRAYGTPLSEIKYVKEAGGILLQYEGVSFVTGIMGNVSKIKIVPPISRKYQRQMK